MKDDPFFKATKQKFDTAKHPPKSGERTNLTSLNLCSAEGHDRMLRGKIIDGRRYLGNGAWERVDVETSELNERREGRQ